MSLHHAKDEAISFLAAQHRTKAERRARLREELLRSGTEREKLAVRLAEYGHTVSSIMLKCGVPEVVALILVTGEEP